MILKYRKLHPEAIEPTYGTPGAAGADLYARTPFEIYLQPGVRAMILTGIAIELPAGFEAQVRPRSGLAHKHGLTVLNAPGTIDEDFRGEIGVILINHGYQAVKITHGDRIAQIVVAPVQRVTFQQAGGLSNTELGAGGFGSTGVST